MDLATYYTILGVSRDAGATEIRQSYRAALLRVHPDKQPNQILQGPDSPAAVAIARIQDAYRTLSDPVLRAEYDQLLKEGRGNLKITQVNQRPANEVSLDEFTVDEVEAKGGGAVFRWVYPCRCGSLFVITEDELGEGIHYIGCTGCSEVVWVGYEAVDDISDDGQDKSNNL